MKIIHIQKLKELIEDVFTRIGLSREQIDKASEIMLYADTRGIDSHGVILLKTYVDRIKEGIINKEPSYKWESKSKNIKVLHGDRGIGHFLGDIAMEEAIKLADKYTIGLVFVNNATHYGALGYFSEKATREKMLGFTATNTMPLMAPTGGIERVLGNNPISFAVPRQNNKPIILDMATSIVAAGRLILANQKGESIPAGWALDKHGNPTTDPYEGFEGGGSIIPLGGHKGYGLAFFIDLLTGVLSGASFGQNTKHSNLGFVLGAINYSDIMGEEEFHTRLEEYISMIKNVKTKPGVDKVYLPGEMEQEVKIQRELTGIPINEKLYIQLQDLFGELNMELNKYFKLRRV